MEKQRLIDANALKQEAFEIYTREYGNIEVVGVDAIDAAPTIDPERRGRWLQDSPFDEDANVFVCSVCNEPWVLIDGTPQENNMNYCPNCGARMDEDGGRNDG